MNVILLNVFNANAKIKVSTSSIVGDLYCSAVSIVTFVFLRGLTFDIVMDPL